MPACRLAAAEAHATTDANDACVRERMEFDPPLRCDAKTGAGHRPIACSDASLRNGARAFKHSVACAVRRSGCTVGCVAVAADANAIPAVSDAPRLVRSA